MNSWLRKAAFAARFGDWNPLISNFVTDQSKILYVRDIKERVQKVAPFLQYDHDPYPVLADGQIAVRARRLHDVGPLPERPEGRHRGSGRPTAGCNTNFNYVRNSVKVVVDAYDGTVKMYVIDPNDPIIQAYQSGLPRRCSPTSTQMPDSLREHLRYPEDLFKVQTTMWGRYHIDDPQSFYDPTNGWNVAKDPGTTVAGAGPDADHQRRRPDRAQGRSQDRSVLPDHEVAGGGEGVVRPLHGRSCRPPTTTPNRSSPRSWSPTATPTTTGELQVYEVPSQLQVDGPSIVNSLIQAQPAGVVAGLAAQPERLERHVRQPVADPDREVAALRAAALRVVRPATASRSCSG